MKETLVIIIFWLTGCTQENQFVNGLDEDLIFDHSSNWHVKLDPLVSIDDFILAYRSLRRENSNPIKPYITTSTGLRVSLRELRSERGGGYVWDCRAHMKIMNNLNGDYLCIWNSGQSCNQKESRKHINSFSDIDSLTYEVFQFYSSNSKLELSREFEKNDLEVWITSLDDELNSLEIVIEAVALGFQEFCNTNKNVDIPFSIVISPKQDRERMNRIRNAERTYRNTKPGSEY